MKNLKMYITAFVLSTLFSCNRNEDNIDRNADSELVTANAIADYSSEIDFNYSIDLANSYSSYSNKLSSNETMASCATISVNNSNPGVFPKVFTVDFGIGCTLNGVTRSGVLTITLSDYLLNNGSVLTIERSNYYVNNNKIEGTVVYTNQTTNATIPKWSRTITNGKITFANGAIFTHNGTRTVQQIEGVGTAILADNVYEILSGTHTVNRPNGTSLTATVITPLIKKFACNYISQGSLNLQGTYLNGILDYGNNTCDNQATYTHSNGQTYTISL
ncbi:Probable lipoprotein precursor [Flavobacterium indicum GPTSA100-9 = DSM 17447]|uniref:Probable lipoprotein n=1 Tax=Flavobacterium indicum (strain DSM 17447 / CIP 109464 / GPTSA100-9) TaxID=1094466 RepID=H8XVQ7_FLAIG|nr:hypothetical protein [Flavobacterium indicum]CCG54021.1 Probable lipoprotein precursor [Flavobacterium indicum GPTSA100-9 = DSM 17447]